MTDIPSETIRQVKPLVWTDETEKWSYPHRWKAEMPCGSGRYSLTGDSKKNEWQWFRDGYFVRGHYNHKPMPLDDAKAAAQADFDRRILAALQ